MALFRSCLFARCFASLFVFCIAISFPPSGLGQETPLSETSAEETAEEKKERVTAERFLQLLKRRPFSRGRAATGRPHPRWVPRRRGGR